MFMLNICSLVLMFFSGVVEGWFCYCMLGGSVCLDEVR